MKNSQTPIIGHFRGFFEYLDLEKGLSDKSRQTYGRLLQQFAKWLEKNKLSNLKPHQLTEKHIWEYRVDISKKINKTTGQPLKKTTHNYYLIALRNLLNYFADRGIVSLPSEKIKLTKSKFDERAIKFLELEQIKNLLEAPDISTKTGLRDRAILETLFSTGVRVAELRGLNREQVKITPATKDLEVVIIGKGSRPRPIYFSERAIKWLKKYLETREDKDKALFINYKGPKKASKRLTDRSIENIVKKYAIKAGIPTFTTPHTLRHCLHPATRIVLTDKVISARELYFSATNKAQAIDWETLKLRPQKIIEKSSHLSPLLSIWADGHNLVCSPNHRLFTIGKYGIQEVLANEVKLGDYIMAADKIEVTEKRFIKSKLARLLGYVLGDGTVSRARTAIILCDKSQSILEAYKRLVENTFFEPLNLVLVKSKNRNSWELRIYSKELTEFFLSLGLDVKSKERRMPWQLFSATLEELSAFMAGYYDAEGNTGNIRMFSSSLGLLKDIQTALLRFGINSHINYRKKNVVLPQGRNFSHEIYTLYVLQRPDQLAFKEHIKTWKNRNLKVNAKCLGRKIPAGKLLSTIKQDANKKNITWIQSLRDNHHISEFNRYIDKIIPTEKTLEKIIAQLEKSGYSSFYLDTLAKITRAENIKWLKVKKKTTLHSGRHCTYDFGLKQQHGSIITDGIISHNSFATDLLAQGVDLRTLQEFLGHKNISTTQIYAHITSKKLRDTHRKFHGGKNL